MWRQGEKEMKYLVKSTGGHTEYTEDYEGSLFDFIMFKFGGRTQMENQGISVEEAPTEEPTVEDKPKVSRKKKVDDAE